MDNIKDLAKLIALCRKNGIERVKMGDTEVVFSPSAFIEPKVRHQTTQSYAPGGVTESKKIVTDELTPEQLLFYSSDMDTASETQ